MTGDKKLEELDINALIEIIDHPTNKGKVKQTDAIKELKNRNISSEKIKEVAIVVNNVIAHDRVMEEGIAKEEVSLHDSLYLSNEEIKVIYIGQLEKLIKNKDQFRFDVWSYAIGG